MQKHAARVPSALGNPERHHPGDHLSLSSGFPQMEETSCHSQSWSNSATREDRELSSDFRKTWGAYLSPSHQLGMKAVTCLTPTLRLLLLVLTQVEVGLNFVKQAQKDQIQTETGAGMILVSHCFLFFQIVCDMQEDRRSGNKINTLVIKLIHLSGTLSNELFCQKHSPFM